MLPSNAVAVMVLEAPEHGDPEQASTSSLLALGYAAGALGADRRDRGSRRPAWRSGATFGDFATVVMRTATTVGVTKSSRLLSEARLHRASGCVVDQAIVIEVSGRRPERR